jgi:hypothetical protein
MALAIRGERSGIRSQNRVWRSSDLWRFPPGDRIVVSDPAKLVRTAAPLPVPQPHHAGITTENGWGF